MSWYEDAGSPEAYDKHFDAWSPKMQRQVENPWPYKIEMVKKTKGLVLDAGCGFGLLSSFIENGVFLDFSIVGLTKRWIGKPNDRRVLASVEDMPFRNEVFDSVIAIELIEHTDNPHNFVGEVHRVLKSGGLFAFSYPPFDPSPAHHFKRVSSEMVNKWLSPFFLEFETQVFRNPHLIRVMVFAEKTSHCK